MSFSGRTPVLNLPYPRSGELLDQSGFSNEYQILENYILAALLGQGGTRVFDEGSYAATVDGSNNATVTLTGAPSIQGIANYALIRKFGTISWPAAAPGSFYYLYLVAGNTTYTDPTLFTPTLFTTLQTNVNDLYLATLDNTTPGTPVLNTSPSGKPIGANLFTLLNSPVNPFGAQLQQAILTVTSRLIVQLAATSSASFIQSSTSSTQPVITIQQGTATQPHIKGTNELRFADQRTVAAGIQFSDVSNTTLPGTSVSILGALRQGLFPPAIALIDAPVIATDASLGHFFTVTLGGNRTLGQPTNPTNGQVAIWRFRQDATGSRTLAYNSVFRFPPSIGTPTLSTPANSVDYLQAAYNSTDSKWDVQDFVSATGTSGVGTVTSVGLSLPSSVYTITNSPVTGTGVLTGTFKNQTANTFFRGPVSGSPAVPGFGTIVAADLPSTAVTPGTYTLATITVDATGRLTAAANGSGGSGVGTVTSIALALPSSVFVVSGSPITTSGTLAGSFATQAANTFLRGPVSGSPATPSFGTITTADLPTTTVSAGSYTNANVTVDATGRIIAASNGSPGTGTVTTVGVSTPAEITGSVTNPTTTPVIVLSWNSEPANTFLRGPTSGSPATPSYGSIVAADLPNTAVTPGSYTLAAITVDAAGRITAASNGSAGISKITSTIGDGSATSITVTHNMGTRSLVASLIAASSPYDLIANALITFPTTNTCVVTTTTPLASSSAILTLVG